MSAETKTSSDYRKELDELKKDLSSLRDDIKGLSKAIGSEGHHRLDEMRDRVRSGVRDMEGRMHDTYGRARTRSHDAVDVTRNQVEHRPFTSLLIAFAGGALLGMLFHQRR